MGLVTIAVYKTATMYLRTKCRVFDIDIFAIPKPWVSQVRLGVKGYSREYSDKGTICRLVTNVISMSGPHAYIIHYMSTV